MKTIVRVPLVICCVLAFLSTLNSCQPSVDDLFIPVPKELALSALPEDTLEQLRAEVVIEGVLAASPLKINREKDLAMGTFTIPNNKMGENTKNPRWPNKISKPYKKIFSEEARP